MSLTHIQLLKFDGDEIPFTPLNTANSDFSFFAPVPDYIPTDEEVAEAIAERRRKNRMHTLEQQAEYRTKD